MTGPAVVLMGVSGSGKTAVGMMLAERHGFRFLDGDDFHPSKNVEMMRAGIALDDAARAPWLERLAAELRESAQSAAPTALACSCLKRSYRRQLAQAHRGLLFAHFVGAPAVIAARLAARKHSYMSASLLSSQFADLEMPGSDEHVLTLGVEEPLEVLASSIIEALAARAAGPVDAPVAFPLTGCS